MSVGFVFKFCGLQDC